MLHNKLRVLLHLLDRQFLYLALKQLLLLLKLFLPWETNILVVFIIGCYLGAGVSTNLLSLSCLNAFQVDVRVIVVVDLLQNTWISRRYSLASHLNV